MRSMRLLLSYSLQYCVLRFEYTLLNLFKANALISINDLKGTIGTVIKIYRYFRTLTAEQDANRAKLDLDRFVNQNALSISAWFIENESGATLMRSELFRLLDVADKGNGTLVEQVDSISKKRFIFKIMVKRIALI